MKPQWIFFLMAVPLCLYELFYGVVSMGFCPGWGCLHIVWPLIAATPCLLLAIWSLRAAAVVMSMLALAFLINNGFALIDDQRMALVLVLAALLLGSAALAEWRQGKAVSAL